MRDENLDMLIEKVEEAGYDVIEGEDDLYEVASNMGYSVVGSEDDLKNVAEDLGYKVFKYDSKPKPKARVKIWENDGKYFITDCSVDAVVVKHFRSHLIYEGEIEGVILKDGKAVLFEDLKEERDSHGEGKD